MKAKESIIAVLVFFVVLGVYGYNYRHITSGDCIPNKYIPVSILKEFNLNLDEFTFLYEEGLPYYLLKKNEHYYSLFPIGTALTAVPLYVLSWITGNPLEEARIAFLDRISPRIFIALSSVFIFLALVKLSNPFIGIILTIAYSFGTNSWATSSQALWSHSSSQLINAVILWLFVKGSGKRGITPLVGFFMGFSIICRPTNAVIFLIMMAYILHKHKDRFFKTLVFAVPPLLFYFIYNLNCFGHLLGGYGFYSDTGNWAGNSLLLILLSPSRGLLFYSPIIAIYFWGLFSAWRKRQDVLMLYFSLIPVVYLILYSKSGIWWGGWCFGPRYYTDVLPFVMVLMIPVFNTYFGKKWFKGVAAFLMIISMGVQYTGVHRYDYSWDSYVSKKIDDGAFSFWSLRDSQLLYFLGMGDRIKKRYYLMRDNEIDFRKNESRNYCSYGFGHVEEWGVWADWGESVIYFYLPEKGRKERTIAINATSFKKEGNPQTLSIYLNGKFIIKHEFQKPLWEWETIEKKIPGEYFNNSVEKLKFYYENSKQMSPMDSRSVRVAFKNIKIL